MIKIVECPRDAMQGIKDFIPTKDKAAFINQLLRVGYDTIDFGSFVSPKAIPQMSDTSQVLDLLDLSETQSSLLAIVANKRGAIDAVQFEQIGFLGFPFSISETFQLRNTNSTIEESIHRVFDIQDLCRANNRKLVVYLSMGFGNPYGDPWNAEIALKWVEKMVQMGISIISLSDTVGVGTPESISYLFDNLVQQYPQVEFGAHLHTRKDNWMEKVQAAYNSGCRRFDGALMGYGGCPMAKDELVGNMPSEYVLSFFRNTDELPSINYEALHDSLEVASQIFEGL